MTESEIQNSILLSLGARPDVRLFRNNCGTGWCGQVLKHTGDTILLRNPRPLHAGLITGSADLIGWQSVQITEAHLGSVFARFLSVEIKSERGRLSSEQKTWLANVTKAGGLAVVTDDPNFQLP